MRVAVFTDNDFGKVNGVTTSLTALVAHAPAGIQLRVYTAEDLEIDELQYLALPSVGMAIPFYGEMRMYFPRFLAFLRRARRDGVDLIHLTTPGPMGLVALFVAWRMGRQMVGSFHTDLAAYTAILSGSPRLGALMGEYMRWPYGRCQRIFVPSQATRDMLVTAKINPAKLALWRRGVDCHLFTPTRRRDELRARWHVSDRRPAIAYAGRVSREKGLALLPKLEAALWRRHVPYRLIVIGDGPFRPELKALCPDAVFTGCLSRPNVADALASADLFVFPSETDSAGNVVLEAQASGLPVLVADRNGPSEYIVAGATGFSCASGDADQFAARAGEILGDAALRGRMRQAARTHALSMTWKTTLQPVYDAYRELADDSTAFEDRGTTRADGAAARVTLEVPVGTAARRLERRA